MLCTKPPPKRVVTLALRWSRRMTVSEPDTLGASSRRSVRAPKSCVTVSRVPAGFWPAPGPQPAAAAASTTRSAHDTARRRRPRVLADVEHTAVAAPPGGGVAVEGLVDGLDIEHVVPAAEPIGQQVLDRGAVADREVESAAAPGSDEPLPAAAEREAALPDAAREPQLDGADAGAALGDGDADQPRGEPGPAIGVPVARTEHPRARRGAVDGRARDGLRGRLGRGADGDRQRIRADPPGLRRLQPLEPGLREGHARIAGRVGRRTAHGRTRDGSTGPLVGHVDG